MYAQGKRLKKITPTGHCMQTEPCQHTDTILEYEDGSTETVYMAGDTAIALCREHNIPIPAHWDPK